MTPALLERVKRYHHLTRVQKIAQQESESITAYHGTTQGKFDAFKPNYRKGEQLGFGIHFAAEEDLARLYAFDDAVSRKGKEPTLYTVRLHVNRMLDLDRIVSEGDPDYDLAKKIAGRAFYPVKNEHGVPSVYLQNAVDASPNGKRTEQLIRAAGYDGVRYKAKIVSPNAYSFQTRAEGISYIVFDPDQVEIVSMVHEAEELDEFMSGGGEYEVTRQNAGSFQAKFPAADGEVVFSAECNDSDEWLVEFHHRSERSASRGEVSYGDLNTADRYSILSTVAAIMHQFLTYYQPERVEFYADKGAKGRGRASTYRRMMDRALASTGYRYDVEHGGNSEEFLYILTPAAVRTESVTAVRIDDLDDWTETMQQEGYALDSTTNPGTLLAFSMVGSRRLFHGYWVSEANVGYYDPQTPFREYDQMLKHLKENAVTSYFKADYYQVQQDGNKITVWLKDPSRYYDAVEIYSAIDGAVKLQDVEQDGRVGISFELNNESYPETRPDANLPQIPAVAPTTAQKQPVQPGINESVKGYSIRNTAPDVWRVFKDGQTAAISDAFKTSAEARAWLRNYVGVNEVRTQRRKLEAGIDQYWWVVKKGTKSVVEGPFDTKAQAEQEAASLRKVGDAIEVVQGDFLGNGQLADASADQEYDGFEDWADALVAKYGPEVDYEPDAGDDQTTRAMFNGRLVGVFHADANDDMTGSGTVMAGSSTAAPLDEAKWEPAAGYQLPDGIGFSLSPYDNIRFLTRDFKVWEKEMKKVKGTTFDDRGDGKIVAMVGPHPTGLWDGEAGVKFSANVVMDKPQTESSYKVAVYPPKTGQNQTEQWMATTWLGSGKEGQKVGLGKNRDAAVADLKSQLEGQGSNAVLPRTGGPDDFNSAGVDWFQKEDGDDAQTLDYGADGASNTMGAMSRARRQAPGRTVKKRVDGELPDGVRENQGYEVPSDNSLPYTGQIGGQRSLDDPLPAEEAQGDQTREICHFRAYNKRGRCVATARNAMKLHDRLVQKGINPDSVRIARVSGDVNYEAEGVAGRAADQVSGGRPYPVLTDDQTSTVKKRNRGGNMDKEFVDDLSGLLVKPGRFYIMMDSGSIVSDNDGEGFATEQEAEQWFEDNYEEHGLGGEVGHGLQDLGDVGVSILSYQDLKASQ